MLFALCNTFRLNIPSQCLYLAQLKKTAAAMIKLSNARGTQRSFAIIMGLHRVACG
jgi:hypothetical protein